MELGRRRVWWGLRRGREEGLRVEGNQKGMREFEDGSTEEMINELAKKGRIHVLSQSSLGLKICDRWQ